MTSSPATTRAEATDMAERAVACPQRGVPLEWEPGAAREWVRKQRRGRIV